MDFITYGFGAVRLAALLDFQSIYVMDWDEFGPSKDSVNKNFGSLFYCFEKYFFWCCAWPAKMCFRSAALDFGKVSLGVYWRCIEAWVDFWWVPILMYLFVRAAALLMEKHHLHTQVSSMPSWEHIQVWVWLLLERQVHLKMSMPSLDSLQVRSWKGLYSCTILQGHSGPSSGGSSILIEQPQ